MANELTSLPMALVSLRQQLAMPEVALEDLTTPLRALQQMGLSEADLRVHIERWRAANDAIAADEVVEENALLALDIITGQVVGSLRWDPAEIARISLPKALAIRDVEFLEVRVAQALAPHDMIPPRTTNALSGQSRKDLAESLRAALSEFRISPQRADFVRVPKAGSTSRPAALLAPQDRLIYEGLAQRLTDAVEEELPPSVIWPRPGMIEESSLYGVYSSAPENWDDRYVIRADIESFYECVDHAILATFAGGNVQSGKVYPRALEAFLDAVMGTRSGIPQGPAASEVFAAAYLMPLDQKMSEHGWKYVRYADDFLIGADSVTDGRRKLGRLEEALHEIGLRLNSSKTLIMRTPTYLAGLRGNPRQDEFRSKIREIADSLSSEPPSADEDESESEFFNEDELNFLEEPYRETVTLDEVLEDVSGKVNPLLVEAYGVYLKRTAESLGNSPSRDNDLGNLERDLRECLTVVTASRHEVDLAAIDRVLRWFPKLAEYVAAYLRSAAPNFPLPVVEMLRDWLRPDADIDWVTAWLTYVAEAAPRLVDAGLEELLQKLALNPSVGVLTRSGAIRALAAARKLDTKTWSEALNGASSAMRAELILSRLANPDRYPGQSAEIESE